MGWTVNKLLKFFFNLSETNIVHVESAFEYRTQILADYHLSNVFVR